MMMPTGDKMLGMTSIMHSEGTNPVSNLQARTIETDDPDSLHLSPSKLTYMRPEYFQFDELGQRSFQNANLTMTNLTLDEMALKAKDPEIFLFQ